MHGQDSTQVHSQEDLQQQVDLLRRQLARAEKLTALGELVGTTTHEFNNVLMTIMNWAKHGLRHKDNATREKAFETILNAANRGARITNGVLGIARNRSHAMEPTDLAKLLEDSLLLLEREMHKYRIKLDAQLKPVPNVLANGNQIQQVVLNLLINARQAMPNGGRLIVRLTHDQEVDTVDLLIRDFGTGIPPEVLPKIFDPFFSTKNGPDSSGKGGTGLGLSSCRDIIEAHAGRIRVESTLGKGTAFTIRLPVHRETEQASEASEQSSGQTPPPVPPIRGNGMDSPSPTTQ